MLFRSMLTFITFTGAFLLTVLLLPVFNGLSGQNISGNIIFLPVFLAGAFMVYLLTTLVAASYPALYLSGFAPLTVIRQSAFVKGSSHALIRKGLMVIQFAVAVVLIAWVIVIQTQMAYVSDKDIGFDVHNVIGIPITGISGSGVDALKTDYLSQASVSEAAFSAAFPFHHLEGVYPMFKSLMDMREAMKGTFPETPGSITLSRTDPEIVDLLQMKLIAGKVFSQHQQGDTIVSAMINRKTVEYMGTSPEEVIGKQLPVLFGNVYVSGVIEDFNYSNLHEPITPYAFHNMPNEIKYLLLKVKEGNMSQQLAAYEQIFKKHFPNDLFEVKFPDIELEKAYEADRQTNRMALSFSILAILVACMGVFGLTAFMAEQRTKEIGIRKVLGASVGNVVR